MTAADAMTLSGKRIVVTGVTGQIALPLAAHLAQHNEVFGVARFGGANAHAEVVAAGIHPVVCNLADGDLSVLPNNIDYVLHLAVYQEGGVDYDEALRVNAEATGLLLHRYRDAQAALVMSTASVYRPHADPLHVYRETDPLGDSQLPHAPTYGISKIGQEAVARTCARQFGLPVVIARMNAAYGTHGNGGLLGIHLRTLAAGRPVVTRGNPMPYQPIHQDDIDRQAAHLLAAATSPATVVNWAGDEAVTVQEWCSFMGDLLEVEAVVDVVTQPGTLPGSLADVSRRTAATGPCTVTWRDGVRRQVEHMRSNPLAH
jgi:nucleoside-diphosphate-sugar epimerase